MRPDDYNPYLAPESSVVEDWIAVDPPRRSIIFRISSIVIACFCWFFASSMIVAFCYTVIPGLLRTTNRVGWMGFLGSKPGRNVMIALLGWVVSVHLLGLGGRALWKGRGRHGLILGGLGFGVFFLSRLVPYLP